jgi:hypothetical protein
MCLKRMLGHEAREEREDARTDELGRRQQDTSVDTGSISGRLPPSPGSRSRLKNTDQDGMDFML